MSDKLHMVHAPLSVPFCFEWKNRQQQIDVAIDAINSSRPPGPSLRTNVVDHFKSTAVKRTRESQVELGPVHENDCVWPSLDRRGFQPSKRGDELRKDPGDLQDSHDRKLIGVDDRFDSRGAHQWPGRTEVFDL